MKTIKSIPAILAGGAALGFGYPPGPFPFVAFVALVPLLAAWSASDDGWTAFRHGFVFFLACFAVAFHWPMTHLMWTAAWASLAPVLALALALSLPFGLTAPLIRRFGRVVASASLVAAYLLTEVAIGAGPTAIPWPLLGNVLADQTLARQLAAISGVSGLSLWILAVNLLMLLAVEGRLRRVRAGVAAIALLGGGLIGGAAIRNTAPATDWVRLVLAQPAIDPLSWSDVERDVRSRALYRITDSLFSANAETPDLVIWPETALPACRKSSCGESDSLVRRIVDERKVPLLSGAIIAADPSSSENTPADYFNSALLVQAGKDEQRYDKIRLVPFAEFVPLSRSLPRMTAFAVPSGGVSGYRKGERRAVFDVDRHRVGILICFESVFSRDARALARHGAQFLAVLSQNGWWRSYAAYRQHLAYTRLRAVETGRAVIFASASGPSAVLDADGSTIAWMPYMHRGAIISSAPVRNVQPVYLVLGDWVTPLSVVVAAYVVLVAALRRRRT